MKFSTIGENLKQLVLSDDTLLYYLNAINIVNRQTEPCTVMYCLRLKRY